MRKTHNPKVEYEKELEIIKAVAQAWLSHRSSNTTLLCNEFDARRRNFHGNPTRFRLEATRKKMEEEEVGGDETAGCAAKWNFNQSLWDPYEIVAVSKRLEEGLSLGNNHGGLPVYGISDIDSEKFGDINNGVDKKRRKESKNSLRNLFNMAVTG